MSLSTSEFWKLTVKSRLLSTEDCQQLNSKFRTLPDGATADAQNNAKLLARWLISEKKLTEYQAKSLLSGLAGPFHFGDYLVRSVFTGGHDTRRFKAIHLPTRHKVILHFRENPDSISDQAWEACRQLANRHKRVQHPNLDVCYETLTRTKHKIAVTEDIKGKSLAALLNTKNRMLVRAAASIILQAAKGLRALHNNGLVHGQIQPSSICVQMNGHVRLFRHPTSNLTAIDPTQPDPKGKWAEYSNYFAPELAGPVTPTAATDIYALGCTFFEMLTGDPPFAGGDFASKMIRHAQESIPSLDTLAGSSKELTDIVAFMMAKNHQLRLRIDDVIERLEPFRHAAGKKSVPVIRPTRQDYISYLDARQTESTSPVPLKPVDSAVGLEDNKINTPTAKPAVIADSNRPDNATEQTHLTSEKNAFPSPTVETSTASIIDRQRNKASLNRWLLISSGVGSLVVVVIVLASLLNPSSNRKKTADSNPETSVKAADKPSSDSDSSVANNDRDSKLPESEKSVAMIEDDGESLWASPTSGSPIDVEYLESGTQLVGIFRIGDILNAPDANRSMRALGPDLNRWFQVWLKQLNVSSTQIDTLTIGLKPNDVGHAFATAVIRLNQDAALSKLANQAVQTSDAGVMVSNQRWSLFQPSGQNTIVASTAEHAESLFKSQPTQPLLSRDLKRMLSESDANRHATLVSTPTFLKVGGRHLFADNRATVRENLLEFMGDDVRSAMVSLHVDKYTFGEMVLGLEASTSVFNKRDEISQRTEQLPNQLTQFLGTASVDRHWQRLAIQFPMMVSQLAKYTRTVPGKNKVVANFVLPPKAAHNLLLASEFSVASLASTPTAVASSPPSDQDPMTHVTTLQFDQQSLEFALRDLQSLVNDELRISNFEIKIAGKDLQLDGITRNQQIKGFSAKNTPVAQILTQIVMLANPDRQTSAADSNQKLLWVLNPLQPDRGTSVLVTTRKAADENGYKLPEPFRPTGT